VLHKRVRRPSRKIGSGHAAVSAERKSLSFSRKSQKKKKKKKEDGRSHTPTTEEKICKKKVRLDYAGWEIRMPPSRGGGGTTFNRTKNPGGRKKKTKRFQRVAPVRPKKTSSLLREERQQANRRGQNAPGEVQDASPSRGARGFSRIRFQEYPRGGEEKFAVAHLLLEKKRRWSDSEGHQRKTARADIVGLVAITIIAPWKGWASSTNGNGKGRGLCGSAIGKKKAVRIGVSNRGKVNTEPSMRRGSKYGSAVGGGFSLQIWAKKEGGMRPFPEEKSKKKKSACPAPKENLRSQSESREYASMENSAIGRLLHAEERHSRLRAEGRSLQGRERKGGGKYIGSQPSLHWEKGNAVLSVREKRSEGGGVFRKWAGKGARPKRKESARSGRSQPSELLVRKGGETYGKRTREKKQKKSIVQRRRSGSSSVTKRVGIEGEGRSRKGTYSQSS